MPRWWDKLVHAFVVVAHVLVALAVVVGVGLAIIVFASAVGSIAAAAVTPSRPVPPPTSSAITMPDEVGYAVADTKGQIICWCDLTGCYAAPGVTQAPMPAEGPHVP